MKALDIGLTIVTVALVAFVARATPACFQLEPTDKCGEFKESQHTFDCGPIENHPTWIITPGDIFTCATNFEGAGSTQCQNNAGPYASSTKTTFWCENGVLKQSSELWQTCLSGGIGEMNCQGTGGGGEPGSNG